MSKTSGRLGGVAVVVVAAVVAAYLLWPEAFFRPVATRDGDAEGPSSGASSRSPTANEWASRKVAPRRAVSVRGVVRAVAGPPISEAAIRVEAPSTGSRQEGLTDRDGAFSIDDVIDSGDLIVHASREGFSPAARTVVAAPVDQVIDVGVIELAYACVMTGRVVDPSGVGLSGALVELRANKVRLGEPPRDPVSSMDVLEPLSKTTSDGSGRFEFRGLKPGFYDVAARLESLGWDFANYVRVAPGRNNRIELVLGPSGTLAGTVIDAGGAAVPAARVHIDFLVRGLWTPEYVVVLETTDEGKFGFPLPHRVGFSQVMIRALKPGVGVGHETFSSHDVRTPVTIGLMPVRSLTCRFVPDDGSPPPSGLCFRIAARPLPRNFEHAGKTNSEGKATLADFPESDEVFVIVDDPAWSLVGIPGQARFEHVLAGARVATSRHGDVDLAVTITKAGSLTGRVIDRNSGDPVPGVALRAIAQGSVMHPIGRHSRSSAVSDQEGRFRFRNLPRTEVLLSTDSTRWLLAPDGWDGGLVGRGGFDPARYLGGVGLDSRPSADDVIVKVLESGTVDGTVVDAAGTPVQDAEIDAGIDPVDFRTMIRFNEQWFAENFATTTRDDGLFTLRGVFPQPQCRVRARRAGGSWVWSEPFELKPGATRTGLRIQLGTGRTLVVNVRGPDGPVEGVVVDLQEGRDISVGRPVLTRRTGPDGAARFESLSPGDVRVGIDPASLSERFLVPPFLDKPQSLALSGSTTIDVELDVATRLSGTLRDEAGSPLADVSVCFKAQARSEQGTSIFGRYCARSGANGSFSLRVPSGQTFEIIHAQRLVQDGKKLSAESFTPLTAELLGPDHPAIVVLRRN